MQASLKVGVSTHVLQPGSTVATSLAPGEAAPKHAFVLEVAALTPGEPPNWRVTQFPLSSVRPFAHGALALAQALPGRGVGDVPAEARWGGGWEGRGGVEGGSGSQAQAPRPRACEGEAP